MTAPQILAAVDLGSNSFHLEIARVVDDHLYPLDAHKQTVRLGGGVTADKRIEAKTAARALDALRLFAERLRGLPPEAVRVVGTNALRMALNAKDFIREAEATLGFPIEIIAGREEARLIYLGVAHSLPAVPHNRLVIDIGGGSTEFIIGHALKPKLTESLYMGCVSFSNRFFPDGRADKKAFKQAELAARREIETITTRFQKVGWKETIGSSGTAKALAAILHENGQSDGAITPGGLEWLRNQASKAGGFAHLELPGVRPERVPVLPGGLAIMTAIFEELGLKRMQVADTALRTGVLYDLMGRAHHTDVRDATVEQFAKRYHADAVQAGRVRELALRFLHQMRPGLDPKRDDNDYRLLRDLEWAARLHEIGTSIAQSAFHKHSAYILANADMPGFSRSEQAELSQLVLAQRGKLNKVAALLQDDRDFRDLVCCLRLAVLLFRSRRALETKLFSVRRETGGYVLGIASGWLAEHGLTEYGLRAEADEWRACGIAFEISG
ncbi:MAG: exopolyphosphatase [Betaproteobacteria bacterium]|nr:exopolyphosphatase [Betaproteobacteria bacterium]